MSQESSLPVLAVSIIGILATSILLLSYYLFATNCCLNWRRFSIISHLFISGRSRDAHFALCSKLNGTQGLNECAIQVIPSFRFRKDELRRSFHECAVCLNEFLEEERIRMLPNCFHAFHIDCIDTWLQTHESCPICRLEITAMSPLFSNRIVEQSSDQARENGQARSRDGRELVHVSSMGDERGGGGEFGVQLMRRSFSMDSADDRQLSIAVQEILQKNRELRALSGGGEGSSDGGSGKLRRAFFSFSHSISSKSSVLPIQS